MLLNRVGGDCKGRLQTGKHCIARSGVCVPRGSLKSLAQLSQRQRPHAAGSRLEGMHHTGELLKVFSRAGRLGLRYLLAGIDQEFAHQAPVQRGVVTHQRLKGAGIPHRKCGARRY